MSILSKIDYFVEHDLCHSKAGMMLMSVLRRTGISRSIRKMLVYRQMDRGNYVGIQDVQDSGVFYQENSNRIDQICGWLADEESRETYMQTIQFRISKKRKDLPRRYPEEMQYFDKVIRLHSHEVFVDCGAYTGDTAERFIKKTHGKYKKIVCFEPDAQNYRVLQQKTIANLIPIQAGVWSEDTVLHFDSDQATGSKITDSALQNSVEVAVKSIDNTEACADATFIKMDIEGAELPALRGAEKTILRNHPKLAICIYHSNEDMLRIAEYIHSLVPEYKLYVRHYTYEMMETVLYAVMD